MRRAVCEEGCVRGELCEEGCGKRAVARGLCEEVWWLARQCLAGWRAAGCPLSGVCSRQPGAGGLHRCSVLPVSGKAGEVEAAGSRQQAVAYLLQE